MSNAEGARQILTRGWPVEPYVPDIAWLTHGRRRQDVSDEFWGLANTMSVRAVIYVSYFREIYESGKNDELRVTLDREIRGSAYDGSGRLQIPKRGWMPYMIPYMAPFPRDGVVVELKFDERPPRWMLDLVRIFNLHWIPLCKYTSCIFAQQLHWRAPLCRHLEEELHL